MKNALREGEIFALEWHQIDLKRGTIEVDGTIVDDASYRPEKGPPKTEASYRTIRLPRRAIETLSEHRVAQASAGYQGRWVFPDDAGGLLRKSNFMRRQFKLSNSVALEEGANALDIAHRHGHTDTRMVLDTYGHLFKAAKRRFPMRWTWSSIGCPTQKMT